MNDWSNPTHDTPRGYHGWFRCGRGERTRCTSRETLRTGTRRSARSSNDWWPSAETRADVSVRKNGREVVRLTGGWADAGRTRPWRDDTLVVPYSLSKDFVTLAAWW
ncbi:serine hydrolase [Streptomyces sp. NBC_01314]|uniref:serine hydrolase n=1 Tax=Streptomyces sp. NBC_01314 TaxID=2903821 RepID=UPI003088CDEB|nr:beta-lactamase family protein [Streptomyces sp. NBC_01314]